MSESIKVLFDRLNSDVVFAKRFGGVDNEKELEGVLGECGVSLAEFKGGMNGMRKLSDGELDDVAGGGSGWRITEQDEDGGKAELIYDIQGKEYKMADVELYGDMWQSFLEKQYAEDPYTDNPANKT